MKLTYNATVDAFEVEEQKGVALFLRIGMVNTGKPLVSNVAGILGEWNFPDKVEITFHSYENEIVERLWMLKGQEGLRITLNIEPADGSL